MRNIFVPLAALLVLLSFTCTRTDAQTEGAIPIGKLAFFTAEDFGTAGEIVIHSGDQRLTTEAFKSCELDFGAEGDQIIYSASDYCFQMNENARAFTLLIWTGRKWCH